MSQVARPSRIGHVRLNGAVFYAYHGVSDGEQELGAQYEIDVDILCDLAIPAGTDHLKDAINYEALYARVRNIVMNNRFRLMESIASRVIDDAFDGFPAALEITVCIRKLNPPVNGVVRTAEVALSMARPQWHKLH